MDHCEGCGKHFYGRTRQPWALYDVEKHHRACTAHQEHEASMRRSALRKIRYRNGSYRQRVEALNQSQLIDASSSHETVVPGPEFTIHLNVAGQHSDGLFVPDVHGETNNMEVDIPSNISPTLPSLTPTIPEEVPLPPRKRRLPARFRDTQPEGPIPIDAGTASDVPSQPTDEPSPAVSTRPRPSPFQTITNRFGLFRLYPEKLLQQPDEDLTLEDLSTLGSNEESDVADGENSNAKKHNPGPAVPHPATRSIFPFPNVSSFLFLRWWSNGTTKSKADRHSLLRDVLFHPSFLVSDLMVTKFEKLEAQLDHIDATPTHELWTGEGWMTSTLTLEIPISRKRKDPPTTPLKFSVPGLRHRSITSVVKAALSQSRPSASSLHYIPFKQMWRSPTPSSPEHIERIFDELYTCDDWLSEHAAVQDLPAEKNTDGTECSLPRAIAGLMLWSDATQLANFGSAKLWPLYLFLGNQSKWYRGKPTARECHHIAYFTSLPDSFQDFIRKASPDGKAAKGPLLTHIRRELLHAIWDHLLDDDFVHAYQHGVPMMCGDGVERRIYFRIFTYSADYPEKVLLATIRNDGLCPCTACTMPKECFADMGGKRDMKKRKTLIRQDTHSRRDKVSRARKLIYEEGFTVNSKKVDAMLRSESLVPTENSFSKKLSKFGFDIHRVLTPDILHENLLGTWKALFVHLIRLLYALDATHIDVLNQRFRETPTFGRGIIRRFTTNASEMKNMTGRAYEDLVKCSIPAFEELLPGFNSLIQDFLFCAADWHSLSHLHMHTSSTVQLLENCTTEYGRLARKFSHDTAAVPTVETPKEAGARQRRASKAAAQAQGDSLPTSTIPVATGPKRKVFSLSTVKYHSMGHVAPSIPATGTTDSTSTFRGEMAHKDVKEEFERTNKQNVEYQISIKDRRRELMDKVGNIVDGKGPDIGAQTTRLDEKTSAPEDLAPRFIIGKSQKSPVDIAYWLKMHNNDPATKDFLPDLRDHLLNRLGGRTLADNDIDYSPLERASIRFRGHRLYSHATVRFNYTTYDVRRAQETVNVNNEHRDVMVYAYEDGSNNTHRYWYARVHGIFHAHIIHPTYLSGERFDFLWVRWFGRDLTYNAGWKHKRLDRIGFLPESEKPFGFLDPAAVVRSCHLIPAFAHGRTQSLLGQSEYRDEEGDWQYFYVNRFADCDMMMRYTDLGVGHNRERKSKPLTTYSFPDIDMDDENNEEGASVDNAPSGTPGGDAEGQETGEDDDPDAEVQYDDPGSDDSDDSDG